MEHPTEVLNCLEDFLGIPHQLAAYVHKGHKLQRCGAGLKCETAGKAIHPHPAVDETLLVQMRKVLRPHTEAFYKLVGRDFGWIL